MLTRRRSRSRGGVAGLLIGLLALLGTSAGSGARAASAGDGEPTLSEEYLNERIAPRVGETWVRAEATPPRFALTGDPAGPDDIGNSILAVSSELITLDGRPLGEGDLATPNLTLIDDVVLGAPSWFDGQSTLLVVTGWVATSPDLVDAEIAEVSIAFALPDFDRLEESPFVVEPNADRSINVSVGSLGGELRPGQTFVSGGSFVLSTPTIPVSAGYTDRGWFFYAFLPGTATDVRVIVGASTDGTPESLAVSSADVPEATTATQLTGVPFDPFAVEDALGLDTRDEFVRGVPDDGHTGDELSDDPADEIEDATDGEGELANEIDDGTGDDVLDETDSAPTQEPGSPPLEADEETDSDPAVVGQTVDDEVGDPEPADEEGGDPADGDGGGSLLWLWLLLGGTAVGATLAWQLWKRAHGDDTVPTSATDPRPWSALDQATLSFIVGDDPLTWPTRSDLTEWAHESGTVVPVSGPLAAAALSWPDGGGVVTTVHPGNLGSYWTHLHSRLPILSAVAGTNVGGAPDGSAESALFFGYGAPTIPDPPDDVFVNGPGTYTHRDPSSIGIGLTIPNGWPDNIYVSFAEPGDFIDPTSSDAGPMSRHAAMLQRLMGTRVRIVAVDELPLLASSLLPSQVFVVAPRDEMPDAEELFGIAANLVFDDRLVASHGSLQFVTVAATTHPPVPGDDLAWGYRLLSGVEYSSDVGRVDLRPGDAFGDTSPAEYDREFTELSGDFEYATDRPLQVEEVEVLFAALELIDTSYFPTDFALTESWLTQGPNFIGGDIDQRADRDFAALIAAYSF